eukprot:3838207-Alexandrium_andersonii.AAC.1
MSAHVALVACAGHVAPSMTLRYTRASAAAAAAAAEYGMSDTSLRARWSSPATVCGFLSERARGHTGETTGPSEVG